MSNQPFNNNQPAVPGAQPGMPNVPPPPPVPGTGPARGAGSGAGAYRSSGAGMNRPYSSGAGGYRSSGAGGYRQAGAIPRPRGPLMGQIRKNGSIVYLSPTRLEAFVFDKRQQPIGAGAMGIVYRGKSMKDGRPVAIKEVRPRYAAMPNIRRRAREEARLQYRHRHLIEMLGLVEDPEGPIYIISNFVQGMTLDKHVSNNLNGYDDRVRRIVETFYPVLDALQFLHTLDHPVLHLDIKPSNIMIEQGRTVRLMDLGIAFTPNADEITGSGLLGTPGYAAPEQHVSPGHPLDVDATTDLYETAATIYEMLAGVLPDIEAGIPDLEGIPRPVTAVLRKAMSPAKSDRYASADELRAALQHALDAKSGPAIPVWMMVAMGVVAAGVLAALLVAAL